LFSSLLGDSIFSSIASSIGNYAGMTGGTIKKLLSFILPFILGKIVGATQSKGTSASALQRLFIDQKDNIADAVPSGFSLAEIPGVAGAERVVRMAGKTANAAGTAVRDTTRQAVGAADHTARTIFAWLLPLAALLLAALGLWYLLGPPRAAREAARNAAVNAGNRVTALRPALPDAPELPDLSVVTKNLSGTFTTANQVLSGITDAASAEAALPQLTKLSTTIDGIRGKLDLLPAAGQTALGKLVGEKFGPLQTEIARIMALPNVSSKVKTSLQGIASKLAGLNLAQVSLDATNIFKSLTATLNELKDPAAVETALPKLQEVSSKLDDLKRVQAEMSPGGQSMLAKIISAARGPLDKLIASVVRALGADAAIVKPVLDAIVNKITGLAPAPA
jgi:hypothetical protein